MIKASTALLFFLLTLTGCFGSGSGSLVVPEEPVPAINLRGYLDLKNIKFPTSICGNNTYQFIDLSVFSLDVQDYSAKASVNSNGQFAFSEIPPREQLVVFCKNSKTPNLIFEWMGASSTELNGEIEATVSAFSTARSLIARTLRDRHGKRVNPEEISDEQIETTLIAILEVIEKNPDLLKEQRLSDIESVKNAYTKTADELAVSLGTYPKEHVFLFYFAGDNDLAKYMVETVNSIAKSGQPESTEIVISLDTAHSLPLLNKSGAATYRVLGERLQLLKELGSIDSADSSYLQKFVELAIREYPAKSYSLVLSGHGSGWKGSPRFSTRAVFMNDSEAMSTGSILNVAQSLERAFKNLNASNRKFDVIVLDACNQGCIEIAYEFKDLSHYTVFSQGFVPGEGIPYEDFFKQVRAKNISTLSVLDRANLICQVFSERYLDRAGGIDTGISLVDNSAMPYFIDDCKSYVSGLIERAEAYSTVLYNIRTAKTTNNGEESFGYVMENFGALNEFVDFAQLLENSREVLLDVKLLNNQLTQSLKKLLKYSKYSRSLTNANGISITFPEKELYNSDYQGILPAKEYFDLKFNKETGWNIMLDKILLK